MLIYTFSLLFTDTVYDRPFGFGFGFRFLVNIQNVDICFYFIFFYALVFTIGSVDMNLYSVKGLRCNMTSNTTALHFKPFR